MGESRFIVEDDVVFASHETPLPPRPVMMKTNSIVSRNSYNRLPSQPFTLSVLKLDASFFYVEVSNRATVAELKQAVEAVFSHMPEKISWPHVWGQFCLCYEGQKLVTETDYLRDYGINDGDQLRFIRHHASNVNRFQKKQLKRRVVNLKQHRRCSSASEVNGYQQIGHSDDDDDIGLDGIDIENGKIQHCNEEEDCIGKNGLISGFLGGLFSYTRQLAVVRRSRTEGRNCHSMIARGIRDSFMNIRKMLCFCRRRRHSPRDTWREY